MGLWKDLLGTSKSLFQIAVGGVKLGNSSGNLTVKDGSDAYSDITVKKPHITGNSIEINSGAAGTGADWKLTLSRPSSGMTAALELKFPPADGSLSQILKTDGSGQLGWVSACTLTGLTIMANQKIFGNAGATAVEYAKGMIVKAYTRDMASAGAPTDVTYTGVGFKPSLIIFLALLDDTFAGSIGVWDGTTSGDMTLGYYASAIWTGFGSPVAICPTNSGSPRQSAVVKSFDTDGFTLTWTKVGSPAGMANIKAICFR